MEDKIKQKDQIADPMELSDCSMARFNSAIRCSRNSSNQALNRNNEKHESTIKEQP